MAPSMWLFPIKVWYDLRFYAGVALRGKGIALLPLLATIVFLAFVWTVSSSVSAWRVMQDPELNEIVDRIPELHIRNGTVSSPVEQPWVWESVDSNGKQVFMGLDTTGQISHLPDDVDMGILVTEHQLEVLQQSGRHQITDLGEVEEFDLDSDIAWDWIILITGVGIPFLAGLSAVWTLVVRLVLALAVGGLITAATADKGVSYAGGVRVAVLGMIPPMVLFGLLEATGLLTGWWLLVWLVFLAACAIWWGLAVVGIRADTGGDDVGTAGGPGSGADTEWAPPTS